MATEMELFSLLNNIRNEGLEPELVGKSQITDFIIMANCTDMEGGPGHYWVYTPEDQTFLTSCALAEFLHERQKMIIADTVRGKFDDD